MDEYDPTNGKDYPALSKSLFYHEYLIGLGGFGSVWKVTFLCTGQMLALKEMQKAKIIAKRNVASVINERKLLAVIRHPFIVNMSYAFQDRENLYLAMDLMTGGDLRYHISQKVQFIEEQAKFFAACIITGLEYLHLHKIIHRDIKPENLVLDERGYLRITDFGAATLLGSDNSGNTSGTLGYMAPEVMQRKSHGIAVDYFALGVILYEFLLRKKLYPGKNCKEVRDLMLSKQVQLRRSDIPPGWSIESADFINKLIERKPQQRLGFHGPKEVKNHSWFRGFPWQKLMEKSLPAPFKPRTSDNFDRRHIEYVKGVGSVYRDEGTQSEQNFFAGYYYDSRIKTRHTVMEVETMPNTQGQVKTV